MKEGAEGLRLDAASRSPGNDPLAIWRTCGELKLPVKCHGNYEDFASTEFSKLVKAFPEVPIIIEHLGLGKTGAGQFPSNATYPKLLCLIQIPEYLYSIGRLS